MAVERKQSSGADIFSAKTYNSLPMEIPWLLLALISAAATIFISKILKNQQKPPPGPRPWPIIGNLNLLGSIPHQSLHHLYQKYGELMLLKFGKFPVLVASSPEMAKKFLKEHDAVFASRPMFAAYKHISYNYSDVSFSPYGPYWREARKIFMTKVLSPRNLEDSKQIRWDEGRVLLSRLKSETGKPVELRKHLSRFTLSIIYKMIFKEKSLSEREEDESMEELGEMVHEWFMLNGAFNIGDWVPWLDFLDLQGYVKKMKALRGKMDRFCDSVIRDHLAGTFAGEGEDFVDFVLHKVGDSDGEVEFTMDCVKALIMNLLVAATDTSATAVEWAIHEILRQPRMIEKAKAELDSVVGRNRWVEESDFTQLPYIEAIIMETMRLHPLATLLAPHCAIEDCNISGYNVSKGTVVLVNVWSIGRDPYLWDSPLEFLPERFIGKEIDMTGSDFTLLPFGSGRRRCPGYNLGLKIVRTTLANLLHGFELKLGEGMRAEDVSIEENYGLTTNPKHPVSIFMEPTLPHYLY